MYRLWMLGVIWFCAIDIVLAAEPRIVRKLPPPELVVINEISNDSIKYTKPTVLTEQRVRVVVRNGKNVEETYTKEALVESEVELRKADFDLVNQAGKEVDWTTALNRVVLLAKSDQGIDPIDKKVFAADSLILVPTK